ncbi:hypothetical protein D9M69_477050 [compost metagenome]
MLRCPVLGVLELAIGAMPKRLFRIRETSVTVDFCPIRWHTMVSESGNTQKYTLPITRQPQGHPDFHRVPAAIRRLDPRHCAAVRGVGRAVSGAGMGRHRRLRLHGPAHAPLVRQAIGQADVQPLLRRVAVGGGFGTSDGQTRLK